LLENKIDACGGIKVPQARC